MVGTKGRHGTGKPAPPGVAKGEGGRAEGRGARVEARVHERRPAREDHRVA